MYKPSLTGTNRSKDFQLYGFNHTWHSLLWLTLRTHKTFIILWSSIRTSNACTIFPQRDALQGQVDGLESTLSELEAARRAPKQVPCRNPPHGPILARQVHPSMRIFMHACTPTTGRPAGGNTETQEIKYLYHASQYITTLGRRRNP